MKLFDYLMRNERDAALKGVLLAWYFLVSGYSFLEVGPFTEQKQCNDAQRIVAKSMVGSNNASLCYWR